MHAHTHTRTPEHAHTWMVDTRTELAHPCLHAHACRPDPCHAPAAAAYYPGMDLHLRPITLSRTYTYSLLPWHGPAPAAYYPVTHLHLRPITLSRTYTCGLLPWHGPAPASHPALWNAHTCRPVQRRQVPLLMQVLQCEAPHREQQVGEAAGEVPASAHASMGCAVRVDAGWEGNGLPYCGCLLVSSWFSGRLHQTRPCLFLCVVRVLICIQTHIR